VGDSSKNIRTGDAFQTASEFRDVSRAVLGGTPMPELGKYNGRGKDGFAVSSCQFAVHYFFKNVATFYGFIRNVAENTQMGGYFIGTTYDGETVFRQLEKYKRGDGIILSQKEKIYFKLLKKYDETGFPPDETSLGYAIDVYQESIGQNLEEYLVHFTYFERIMNLFGFYLIESDTNNLLPRGTGMFSQFYSDYSGPPMSDGEKTISMLNRYFVFQRKIEVNPDSVKPPTSTTSKTDTINKLKPPFRKIRSGFIIKK
jgi:hypothetical protein